MIEIALYQPDIPQNLGSLLRLSACMDVVCNIIEPCGFILDDKRIARVGMDYIEIAKMQRHSSWQKFLDYARENDRRIILLSSKAEQNYCNFEFAPKDILLLGRESAGVPLEVADLCDAGVTIKIATNTRSLNIAIAASMVLGEALRQVR
ncbi:MAG: TrmH family RNA methyltransferase [Pseudomonadota bacterium]